MKGCINSLICEYLCRGTQSQVNKNRRKAERLLEELEFIKVAPEQLECVLFVFVQRLILSVGLPCIFFSGKTTCVTVNRGAVEPIHTPGLNPSPSHIFLASPSSTFFREAKTRMYHICSFVLSSGPQSQ